MPGSGAVPPAPAQNHNNELVKCIEELREKREEIARQLVREEEEKAKIQNDLTCVHLRAWLESAHHHQKAQAHRRGAACARLLANSLC